MITRSHFLGILFAALMTLIVGFLVRSHYCKAESCLDYDVPVVNIDVDLEDGSIHIYTPDHKHDTTLYVEDKDELANFHYQIMRSYGQKSDK